MNRTGRNWLAAVSSISLCTGCAAGTAANTSKSVWSAPALVKRVTTFRTDPQSSEWKETSHWDYEYENGYPVSAVFTEYGEEAFHDTFEYTFDGAVPTAMKRYDKTGTIISSSEYNNGNLYEVRLYSSGSSTRQLYQYGLGGEYFTSFLNEMHEKDSEAESPGNTMEEVDSVNITVENGLLTRTVNSGLYANWAEGEEKQWMRFNGTYTADYENGIVKETSSVFRAGPPGARLLFEVKIKDGRVEEVIRSIQYEGQEPMPEEKNVFEYTDLPMEEGRYTRMVNAFIMGSTSTYYNFNWY